MKLQEFQDKYPSKEDREEAVKHMSDEEIDELIASAGIVQAKIEYSRLKKKNQIRRYRDKYNTLATETMKYLALSDNNNVVFSPFSVLMLLSIAADSVDGVTKQEILDVVGSDMPYENYRDMVSEMQRLFTETISVDSEDEDYTSGGEIVSANAVYIKEDFKGTLNADYEDRLSKYHGKLFASKNIVDDVNAWVKENTRGLIDRIADDSMSQMVACLMNAIAFESEWAELYDEDEIYEDEFTDVDGTAYEVQMMDSTEYEYIENDLFTGFIKPYKDLEYSYMALLPRNEGKEAISHVIDSLDLSRIFESSQSIKVYVTMPEFKYDLDRDMTDLFKKMGITTLFTPQADFSPMSSEWLMMDAIIHKAHIEVDRKGTKAAAVSMGVVVCGCAPSLEEYKSVRLDRPFIYAIVNNLTGLPVFAGIVNHIGD